MAFKFNISHKGRTYSFEAEDDSLIRMKIGDKIDGKLISSDLTGYELEITGTSDTSGFPGVKGEIGGHLRKKLLKRGEIGMQIKKPRGLRLRKSVRGEEISEKTRQINMKVLKEGNKKFDEICPPKEKSAGEEKKKEEIKEQNK